MARPRLRIGVERDVGDHGRAPRPCAQRLYEFPLGVFGIAVATAIFPAMARESHDRAAFVSTLRRGLRLTVFIGLPASAGLLAMREPLAATLFQGGRFTALSGPGGVLFKAGDDSAMLDDSEPTSAAKLPQ